jgi:hypothetical protein
MTNDDTPKTNETDADRLLLLDRIADRLPEINLDEHEVAWHQLPDGAPALLVDGGGMVDDPRSPILVSVGSDRESDSVEAWLKLAD